MLKSWNTNIFFTEEAILSTDSVPASNKMLASQRTYAKLNIMKYIQKQNYHILNFHLKRGKQTTRLKNIRSNHFWDCLGTVQRTVFLINLKLVPNFAFPLFQKHIKYVCNLSTICVQKWFKSIFMCWSSAGTAYDQHAFACNRSWTLGDWKWARISRIMADMDEGIQEIKDFMRSWIQ